MSSFSGKFFRGLQTITDVIFATQHPQNCSRRRRGSPLGSLADWLLEERCMPAALLPPADPIMPAFTGTNNPSDVLYYGPTADHPDRPPIPLKTITLTNNTDRTVFPFLLDANSRVYGTETVGQFDPFDGITQEYRGYVGYLSGGTNYIGLPAHATITINVPLVFWDGGRVNIGTDGQYITPAQTPQQDAAINPYRFFFFNHDTNHTPTARAIVAAQTFNNPDRPGDTGLVMWYHGLDNLGPATDCPEQLTEMTFRDTLFSDPNYHATFFPHVDPNEGQTFINYDVSYVDSMVLPVAMEAKDAVVNPVRVSPLTQMPFAWVGADLADKDMQKALAEFTNNTNNALLGQYFGGFGYAKFYNPNEATDGIKIPAGANVVGESPLANKRSIFDQNRYMLTSGGEQPIEVSNPAHPNGTVLQFDDFIPKAFFEQLKAGIGNGNPGWVVTSSDDTSLQPQTTVVDVDVNNRRVTLSKATQVDKVKAFSYVFSRPLVDHVSEALINLWYSWAKYYLDLKGSIQPPPPASGHIDASSRVLTFDNPVNGLEVGMRVSGPGLNPDTPCIIMGIADDKKSVNLSLIADGPGNGSYTFDKVLPIKSADQAKTFNIKFTSAQDKADALIFAQHVYELMSVMSTIPNQGSALQILFNVIGCSVGQLPDAGDDKHQDVHGEIRDITKSALRGVTDFTKVGEGKWYPDPKTATGGRKFNVWNLNPFVWFVHKRLGMSGYGFSVDDDISDVEADGATQLLFSIGGLGDLPNKYEWTPGAPYGKIIATATVDSTKLNQIYAFAPMDYWRIYPKTNEGPGALIIGPGVVPGTRILSRDENNNTFILSQPLVASFLKPGINQYSFTFFGHWKDIVTGVGLTNGLPPFLVDIFDLLNNTGLGHFDQATVSATTNTVTSVSSSSKSTTPGPQSVAQFLGKAAHVTKIDANVQAALGLAQALSTLWNDPLLVLPREDFTGI